MSEDRVGGHVTRCRVSDDDRWCYARAGRVYRDRVEIVVRTSRELIVLDLDDARRLVAEIQASIVEVEASARPVQGPAPAQA